MPITIYFAGPLFSEADRLWIDVIRNSIEGFAYIWFQDDVNTT